MRKSAARTARARSLAAGSAPSDRGTPLPMVEIVLQGMDVEDWVTRTLSSLGVTFRLIACRPSDRGRRRLLRLFEVQTDESGVAPVVSRLRSKLASRDVAVSELGPTRALLRVSVPMPAACSVAFDLGDFCIRCPFLGKEDAVASLSVKLSDEEVRLLEEPYIPHPVKGHQ